MLYFKIALAFFQTTLGKYTMVGLVVFGAYLAGDVRGRRIEHAKCEAAAAAAAAAAKQQDAKAHADAEQNANDTIAALQDQKGKADTRVAELEAQLRTLPLDAPCLYGAGERPAQRVRNNAGKGTSDKKHSGPAGVPAATGRSPSN